MEFVPFTTKQLEYLALTDPVLNPVFQGVFAADQLPKNPEKIKPRAYIVNADPINKPGSHWFGVYTEKNKCEVMDSYGLPLTWYARSDLVPWIFERWEDVRSSAKILQEKKSKSCGQYVLIYLKMRCRGKSMNDFTDLFNERDYVRNDHKVGNMLKEIVSDHLTTLDDFKVRPGQQRNFMLTYVDI